MKETSTQDGDILRQTDLRRVQMFGTKLKDLGRINGKRFQVYGKNCSCLLMH